MIGADQPAEAWWQTRGFAALALLVALAPLLAPALPPLTDVPGHIGRYYVMLHGDSGATLRASYGFEWRLIGNLGVDLIVWLLGQWLPVETAAKLAVLAIMLLTAAGILALAREVHGRLPPTVWFAFPLIYSYPLQFGFLNYTLSIALALLALAGWLRLARQDRLNLRALLSVPVAFVLFVAHLSGWAAFGLMAAGSEFARRRAAGEPVRGAAVGMVIACLPLAWPALIALFGAHDPHALTYDWFLWTAKLQWLLSLLRERFESYDIIGALLLIGVAGVAGRRLGMDARLALPALLCATAFVVLPRVLLNGTYADMRLAPLALLLALLAIRAPADRRAANALALAATGFALVRLTVTGVVYHDIARDQQRELAALSAIPAGASVLALVAHPCNSWATRRIDHLPSLLIPRRHAFVNSEWAIPGQQLLTIRRAGAAPFDRDPSQIVTPPACRDSVITDFPSAIAGFNRNVFTHVWTLGVAPRALGPGLRPVWSDGRSTVYAVARTGPHS